MSVVVFDMDGTLTDTEAVWDEVRRGLAAADGRPWPEGATRAMMGMSTQEWSTYLSEVVGLTGTAEDSATRTIHGLLEHFGEGRMPVLPGAIASVRRMATRWRLGLASSSPRILIDAGIERLGIGDVIEVSLSTEELNGAGKPAPDVYLEVCRRLGADPRRSIAVEDSTNGIGAAVAAGMIVVAVPPHFHPPAAEVLGAADVILDNLDELTVELAEGLLAKR
ncbi:MAG TPA: HAD family hydrolase [Propionibacteriaceae bacterium]|nr:HAD family hydrolase [Propionibacteriaceae bacterium]